MAETVSILLLDTGADISIFKENKIKDNQLYFPSQALP